MEITIQEEKKITVDPANIVRRHTSDDRFDRVVKCQICIKETYQGLEKEETRYTPIRENFVLWEGDEYDAIGQWEDPQADERALEKLK